MDSIAKFCYSNVKGWFCHGRLLSKVIANNSTSSSEHNCQSYLLFHAETSMNNGLRTFLYVLGLLYCFIGLSAITARFFRSMENVVKQTRKIVRTDPDTGVKVVTRERIWNYTLADISLLAFGTSFPQISLAIIDAFQNLGRKYAGGLGPATLVGSAAFDLYPIHAVCVVVPKAGTVKKISDLGVWLVELAWSFWAYIWLYIIIQVWTPHVVTIWEAGLTVLQFGLLLLHAYAQDKGWRYVALPLPREDRPEEWVPAETIYHSFPGANNEECTDSAIYDSTHQNHTVDIFSIHSDDQPDSIIPRHREHVEFSSLDGHPDSKSGSKGVKLFLVWFQQFSDALTLEDYETKKRCTGPQRFIRLLWKLVILPWKFLFAFVPPCHIADGWVAFVSSLCFITGISYILTKLTYKISCVTGINPYVIAFTALASGTSWPDMVASKIAAQRQKTADSAIANITCSNSANLFVGIGVPWLIDTVYNVIHHGESLRVNSEGLSFSLVMFFITFVLCMTALILRRHLFGGELGGPRIWAWLTCFYLMFLWIAFVLLSSLKVSHII